MFMETTKEEIKHAFSEKRRKRNALLYDYYKDKLFNKKYSSKTVAERINKDIGIKLTENMVNLIYHRYAKKQSGEPEPSNPVSSQQVAQKKYLNVEDLGPTPNPFEDLFKNR